AGNSALAPPQEAPSLAVAGHELPDEPARAKEYTPAPQPNAARQVGPYPTPERTVSTKGEAPEIDVALGQLAMPEPEELAGPAISAEICRLRGTRRQNLTEEELRKQLARAPEVSLRADELPALVRAYESSFRTTFKVHADVSLQPTVLLDFR